MRNEPDFSKSQMFITLIRTTNYNKKWTMDTWSKRTQTNPNLPATPFGGRTQFMVSKRSESNGSNPVEVARRTIGPKTWYPGNSAQFKQWRRPSLTGFFAKIFKNNLPPLYQNPQIHIVGSQKTLFFLHRLTSALRRFLIASAANAVFYRLAALLAWRTSTRLAHCFTP